MKQKPNRVKVDLKMVDTPVSIVKNFCSDVHSKYGNIYWVKLMDLMRKAEAYDYLMSDANEAYQAPPVEEPTQDQDGVHTFTGRQD